MACQLALLGSEKAAAEQPPLDARDSGAWPEPTRQLGTESRMNTLRIRE
jgi:hypothetical protein